MAVLLNPGTGKNFEYFNLDGKFKAQSHQFKAASWIRRRDEVSEKVWRYESVLVSVVFI